MNTIENASQQILEAIQTRRAREADRLHSAARLRAVDALIAELEEANLAGRRRVAETMEPALQALAAALPEEFRAELRSRVAISRLMDHLYVIEEYLLKRKQRMVVTDDEHETAPQQATARPNSDYPQAS